ncbi:MAG: hypothetical protein IKI58_00840 [Oscillospiraceae bacterium]|nr:hypothetical protein [Oscillospiraceae bacterium]
MADDFIRKRLLDLASQADRTNRFTFTGFLNEAEQAEYYAVRRELPDCGAVLWGGYEDAERAVLRFGDPERLGYEEPFPVVCLEIAPLQEKFGEMLTHRDYLGAMMHLGIERSEIGDILIREKHAYVFCRETMADYLCRELTRIRHTSVSCKVSALPETEFTVRTEPGTVQVSSPRIDGVAAKIFGFSRSLCAELFAAGKVFVNGACTENHSLILKAGDKVSVRGYGKFRFLGIGGVTRKGRQIVNFERFTG